VNRELGRFLANRRSRLRPTDVGLSPVGRRRVAGLRREEVAALAGVGATWYTMLESGRAANVSEDVLRAVARVLRLTASETDYLVRLARPGAETVEPALSPEIIQVLQATSLPAYVVNRRWYALAWNDAFARLWDVGDREPPLDIVRLLFFEEPARTHHGANLEHNAAAMIAMVRSGVGRRPGDERYRDLAEMLSRDALLSQTWDRYDVADPRDSSRVAFAVPIGATTGYVAWNADIPLSGLTIVYQVIGGAPVGLGDSV
jgi:transcriptional regulator with XRE-family HTH domain